MDTFYTDAQTAQHQEQSLVAFAGELNIARRTWNAYPEGHPLVMSALNRLAQAIQLVLQQQKPLQIGVTRDNLLLQDTAIAAGSPICRTLAGQLFERGICTLCLLDQPEIPELQTLLRLLALKREQIIDAGGIEALQQHSALTAIELRGIRYDRFSGTEEALLQEEPTVAIGLWEQFVKLVMDGEIGLGDCDDPTGLRPEVLAAMLNARFSQRLGVGGGLAAGDIRDTAAQLRAVLLPSFESDTGDLTDLSGDRSGLLTFIAALHPALRRQILNGFCEIDHTAAREAAEEFVRFLGPGTLQETYATVDEYAAAPRILQEILLKLAPHLLEEYATASEKDEIRAKVRVLTQEHHQEQYLPETYNAGLRELLHGSLRNLPDDKPGSILLQSLAPEAVDSRCSEIILQLVLGNPAAEDTGNLIGNLSDMCGYFLETGDYAQVLKILSQAADPRLPAELRLNLKDAFSRREFLDEILSGLSIWGKPKYDQVSLLIQVIGRPFIDPLLDRLTDEENMSLRRFMMDRVLAFGEAAVPALAARLDDQRWYVLRNVVVMLRTLAPGREAERLRPLLRNPHPKVRLEVLKSLLLCRDPLAQRMLARDLEAEDPETRLQALALVDRHTPPEVLHKLLALLNSGGFSAAECDLKTACIRALAETGNPAALPELTRLLATRSLLAAKALLRLKLDIVRSLAQYPPEAAIPVLEPLTKNNNELAALANTVLTSIRSRSR